MSYEAEFFSEHISVRQDEVFKIAQTSELLQFFRHFSFTASSLNPEIVYLPIITADHRWKVREHIALLTRQAYGRTCQPLLVRLLNASGSGGPVTCDL